MLYNLQFFYYKQNLSPLLQYKIDLYNRITENDSFVSIAKAIKYVAKNPDATHSDWVWGHKKVMPALRLFGYTGSSPSNFNSPM